MKKNFFKIILLITALSAAPLPSFARSDDGEDIKAGTLTTVVGKVSIFHRETGRILTGAEGDTLYQGDSVRTKSASYAEVTLDDGSTLKIAQNSRIKITEFLLGDDGTRKSSIIKLFRGKLRAFVSKIQTSSFLKAAFGSSGSNFAVSTPTAVIGVKGTEFLVIHERGRSSVFVDSGEVEYWNISNPESSVSVKQGFYSHSAQGSAPTKPMKYTMAQAVINKSDTNMMAQTKHSLYGGEENVANTGGDVEQSNTLDMTEYITGEDTTGDSATKSYSDEYGVFSNTTDTVILSGSGDELLACPIGAKSGC